MFAVGKGQIEAALSLGLTYPRTMRRIILPQAFRTVIPALGSLVIAMIKNSAIVGGSLVALPDLLKQTREVQADTAQTNEVYLLGRGRLPVADPDRDAGLPLPRAPVRDQAMRAAMGYLFDPDNWEWVWTGNNFRFLLEGFLINLEIALIGIVFSLIFGLLLALMRISKRRLISFPAGVWVDVWRNLPLILIILYLALAVPTSWRQAYGRRDPRLLPRGAPGRARPRRHARRSCSTTPPSSARSCAPGSSRSTAASARRRPRWGSPTRSRCGS